VFAFYQNYEKATLIWQDVIAGRAGGLHFWVPFGLAIFAAIGGFVFHHHAISTVKNIQD
jgi:hypothetical protein